MNFPLFFHREYQAVITKTCRLVIFADILHILKLILILSHNYSKCHCNKLNEMSISFNKDRFWSCQVSQISKVQCTL